MRQLHPIEKALVIGVAGFALWAVILWLALLWER